MNTEQTSKAWSCPVCLETKYPVSFVPCGHSVCGFCEDKLKNCPICSSSKVSFTKNWALANLLDIDIPKDPNSNPNQPLLVTILKARKDDTAVITNKIVAFFEDQIIASVKKDPFTAYHTFTCSNITFGTFVLPYEAPNFSVFTMRALIELAVAQLNKKYGEVLLSIAKNEKQTWIFDCKLSRIV